MFKKILLVLPALIIHAVATCFILFCVGAFVLLQMVAMHQTKTVSLTITILVICASYLYIRYHGKLITIEDEPKERKNK